MSQAAVQLVICPLFRGCLDTGEHIGECAGCGRAVRRPAGVTPPCEVTRLVCTGCAEFWPLPAVPDPREGDGCVCTVPHSCPCGHGCLLCGGLLCPSASPTG